MIPFGDSDIPIMFADFGVPIFVNNIAGVGIVDLIDQGFAGDGGRGVVWMAITSVLIQTSAFPGIKIDDAVILDGSDYTIRSHPRVHDGGLTEISLGAAGNVFDGGAYTDTPGPVIGDALYNPAPTGAPIDGEGF
jgi:hypothetical protein